MISLIYTHYVGCTSYSHTQYPYPRIVQVSAGFAGDDLVCRYTEGGEGGKPLLTNKHLCLPQVSPGPSPARLTTPNLHCIPGL